MHYSSNLSVKLIFGINLAVTNDVIVHGILENFSFFCQ